MITVFSISQNDYFNSNIITQEKFGLDLEIIYYIQILIE